MKKRKGVFVVLDGPDGSGKTTQVALLADRLKRMGKKVAIVDFPQYDKSFFGAMVGQYLKGEYGDVFKISPYLSSLLYALDRWSAAEQIRKLLKAGTIVLANRFTSSNIIHQAAKFTTEKERTEYNAWISQVEFKELHVPKPNRVVFLDVPPNISWGLIERRNRKNHPQGSKRDKHESSRSHLRKAYESARKYASRHPDWMVVSCARGKRLFSPEEIHERVYTSLRRVLG